jgi:O-succinylbenzoate synthase
VLGDYRGSLTGHARRNPADSIPGVTVPGSPIADGIEIIDVSVPMRRPHRAAGTDLDRRRLILVRLRSGAAEGWGEYGPVPGYSGDSADGVVAALRRAAPRLVGIPLDPAAVLASPAVSAGVRHAVESALYDLIGHLGGVPAATLLGGTPGPVTIGAVAGLGAGAAEIAALAGYPRIKLKVAGLDGLRRAAGLRTEIPGLPLAVDANGSLPPDEIRTVAALLDRMDLLFVEQPFSPGDRQATAGLARISSTPVCLDESISGPGDARRALEHGEAAIVALKPARLGGLTATAAALAAVRETGGRAWIGGLLESGVGRAAALAAARIPGCTEPADLTPPLGYLEEDLVAPPLRSEGASVAVPDRPGLGVEVDREAVARLSTGRWAFGAF